jgi:hypothetical protein
VSLIWSTGLGKSSISKSNLCTKYHDCTLFPSLLFQLLEIFSLFSFLVLSNLGFVVNFSNAHFVEFYS